MKTIFRILCLATLLANTAFFSSCSKDEELPKVNTIAVNYVTINGAWQLTEWCGKPLPQGDYCYIVFDRTNYTYKMYDNLKSMYAHYTTGSFTLEQDPHLGDIISGNYDFGNGKWNNKYIITDMLETGSMVWTVSNKPADFSKYVRVANVPQEIIDECRKE